MKPAAKSKAARHAAPVAAQVVAAESLRPWLLAALVALCVARPLLPSEGVSWLGDGQPLVMLALLAAVGTCLLAINRGGCARRPTLVDAAVGGLVLLAATSAVISIAPIVDAAPLGSPRLAINMLWEWVGLGLVYWLTRQLVVTAAESRALVAVMIALAVVVTACGYYQVFVGLPASRAEYAKDPDAALRSLGQWYPPDSAERHRFEDRLNSSEPLATFALTNSLAGFLAPWLIMALGIGLARLAAQRGATNGKTRRGEKASGRLRDAVCLLSVLAITGCVVLTKSRSAYVALAVGVVLLPWAMGLPWQRLGSRCVLAAAATLAVLVALGLAVGGLDAAVITQATRSLGFRRQYWQSTWQMICQRPGWGVGPGNFQDFYTQFKLPEASEEIRDPHNFLLEVWSTAGTPAALALGLALLTAGWYAWRMRPQGIDQVADDDRASARQTRDTGTTLIVAGAVIGALLAFLLGQAVGLAFSAGQLGGGLLIGGAVLWAWWPWVGGGTLAPRLPALAGLVLCVHLLAAGGIAFPGVAGTLWMLIALVANAAQPVSPRPAADGVGWRSRVLPTGALALACSAVVACYLTAYGPVLRCRAAMSHGDDLPAQEFDARINAYLDAAAGDPLAADPWRAIAEIELTRLRRQPDLAASRKRLLTATEMVLALRPHASTDWREAGQWHSQLYRDTQDAQAAETAVQCYQRAVELYPSSAHLRGELALALVDAGQDAKQRETQTTALADARREAELALELDRQMPHADKKLTPALKDKLEAVVAPPR